MPNSSLENSSSWKDKEVHTFSKDIGLKANRIEWLEFELTYFKATTQHFSHYNMENLFGFSSTHNIAIYMFPIQFNPFSKSHVVKLGIFLNSFSLIQRENRQNSVTCLLTNEKRKRNENRKSCAINMNKFTPTITKWKFIIREEMDKCLNSKEKILVYTYLSVRMSLLEKNSL